MSWFGTGSPDLLHEGGLIMAIRIEDDCIALEVAGMRPLAGPPVQ